MLFVNGEDLKKICLDESLSGDSAQSEFWWGGGRGELELKAKYFLFEKCVHRLAC